MGSITNAETKVFGSSAKRSSNREPDYASCHCEYGSAPARAIRAGAGPEKKKGPGDSFEKKKVGRCSALAGGVPICFKTRGCACLSYRHYMQQVKGKEFATTLRDRQQNTKLPGGLKVLVIGTTARRFAPPPVRPRTSLPRRGERSLRRSTASMQLGENIAGINPGPDIGVRTTS